jgi:glycosyltransferase involved in cell wall biosynthesis
MSCTIAAMLSPQVPAASSVALEPCGEGPLPKVSIIVPTRNGLDLLRTCIEGLERTDYPTMEVIVVDNGSDDPATLGYLAALDPARFRVLRDDGPFNFSRLNNRAAHGDR